MKKLYQRKCWPHNPKHLHDAFFNNVFERIAFSNSSCNWSPSSFSAAKPTTRFAISFALVMLGLNQLCLCWLILHNHVVFRQYILRENSSLCISPFLFCCHSTLICGRCLYSILCYGGSLQSSITQSSFFTTACRRHGAPLLATAHLSWTMCKRMDMLCHAFENPPLCPRHQCSICDEL